MSTVNIWNVQFHFEAPVGPLSLSGNPGFITQMNCTIGPHSANAASAASDPGSIAAVLAANGISTPANYQIVKPRCFACCLWAAGF